MVQSFGHYTSLAQYVLGACSLCIPAICPQCTSFSNSTELDYLIFLSIMTVQKPLALKAGTHGDCCRAQFPGPSTSFLPPVHQKLLLGRVSSTVWSIVTGQDQDQEQGYSLLKPQVILSGNGPRTVEQKLVWRQWDPRLEKTSILLALPFKIISFILKWTVHRQVEQYLDFYNSLLTAVSVSVLVPYHFKK